MRKFLTLCAIALAAFSCATPYEQIPEETIQDPSGAKSILPDEIQVTTDGAPTTKAGAIDGYDAGFLGNANKLKFYWDNGDQIDIFGYDDTYHSYVRSALYEVYNLSGGAYDRFTATIKKQSGYLISETFSLNGDVNSVGACVAIYPAGLVSADYGQEHYNGAWTNPTNDDPNHYVKMNLPSRYTLDATSIENDDQYVNVRGMKSQAPMLGLYANTNSIVFHHLEGILKIDFTGIADGVKYYKVTTPGKKINGEYNVPINAKENPRPCIALQSTEDPNEETIVFEYESALAYGNDTKNHVLYIPLPVGTYDKGITVGVYNEDNVLVGQWGVTSLTINRGTLAYTSSFAVERIINAGNAAVINFSECVGAYEDKPTKGVAVNFEDVNHEQNVTLTYGDNLEQKPKYVYIAGNDNTNVGVVSGNLNASTVELLGGKFAGTDLITAANTLNIRQGATVGNINISGGNARVFGKYQNIVVAENATADGVSAPVNVTINPTATAMTSARPTVTVKAPTNLVIAKPEGSTNTTITYVDVVVAATTATTAETALSNITVGENVNVHIVAATGTDVNIETVDAKTNTDADGAITIDPATSETQGDITSIWDGTSKSPLTETDGIYYIYTAAQLAQLAEDVNSKTNYYAGKTVKLMCNIDLDNKAWTPIGIGGNNSTDDLNNEVSVFLGTFDGNDKTISNLKVSQENGDRSFAGLFGNITVNSNTTVTIKDLTVSGVDITSNHMAAGILGRYYGKSSSAALVISNCHVEGTTGNNTITSEPFVNGNVKESGNQAAGIVGYVNGNGTRSITGCSVENVNITGTRDLGGIVGYLNNATFTGNTVSNTTITQSYPNDYESGKDMTTVHEFVGRTFVVDENSNTATNVTIIMQGGEVVARIGNTNYTSLEEAFAAVPTTGAATTVTLLSDATLSASCVIESGKNIILDLGTHNVSGAVNGKLLTNNGTLTINADANNPGGIWNTDTNAQGHDAILNQEGATLTINGGHFGDADTDTENANAVNRGAALRNYGTAVLNGGTFTCIDRTQDKGYAYPIINGKGEAANETATITIKEGVSTYGNTNGSLCANGGTMTVEGGNFTLRGNGSHYSVYSYSGVINVTGGTFVKNYQGCSDGSANIFCVEVDSDNMGFPGQINISGGSFTKNSAGSTLASSADHISITGGTYNVDPSALVASGYEAYQDGSVWKIREAQGVAKIGTTSYASLAAAVAAAQSGDIIELIADDDISLTNGGEIEINKPLTITGATDSNGEPLYRVYGTPTYTGKYNDIFINTSGTVTISNIWFSNFSDEVAQSANGRAVLFISSNNNNAVIDNVYISNINTEAIRINGGSFSINGCAIDCDKDGDKAFTRGIMAVNSATGSITDTDISNVVSVGMSDSTTAAIELQGDGPITVSGCTLGANEEKSIGIAASTAQGLTPGSSSVIVNNCTVSAYIAVFGNGDSGAQVTVNSGEYAGELIQGDNGTGLTITGGTFTVDPATYVAAGYEAVYNGDDTWTVQEAQGVAKIGTTNYASLAAAIAAVPTDGTKTTIQMIANETMATGATLEVASTKNIVLDLNGKTVSGNGGVNGANFFFLTNRGTLEITDSSTNKDGKITGAWTNPDTGWSKQFNTIYNIDGKLTLSAGTVEVTTGNLSYAINNSSNAWGAGDNKETVFTMTGGTVTAPSGDAAVRVYQNCGSNSNPYSHNTLNISGGLIKDSGIFIDTYIYKANPASSGDHINTSINISGGEIHGLIDLKMRHPYNTSVNITNGTFRSSTFRVRKYVDEWGTGLAEPTAPVFNISNGDFQFASSTPSNAFSIMRADQPSNVWSTYANQFSITGGTYSVDPSAYVATGYEAVQNGNVWIINQNTGNANGGPTGGGQNNPGF